MNIGTRLQELQEWTNRFFHVNSETSATILITLFTFLVGILLNELIKKISESRLRSIKRKIFLRNLNELENQITVQGKHYLQFSKQIKFRSSDEGGMYSLKIIELYQIAIIKQMGYEDMFKAFFTGWRNSVFKTRSTKKRAKAFSKIWASLEYANSWQQRLNGQAEMLSSLYNQRNIERETALNQYIEFITPKLLIAGGDHAIQKSILGEYLLKVATIKWDWEQKSNRTNPKVVQQHLVMPTLTLNEEYKKNLDPEFLVTSSKILSTASVKFLEMARLLKALKDIFLKQGISFKHHSKLMATAVKWL